MYSTTIVLYVAWNIALWTNRTVAHMLLPVVAGLGTGAAVAHLMSEVRTRQHRRLTDRMPLSIQATANDDGTTTAVVTRFNGDVTTLLAPEGYSPEQDNGAWVLRQLLTDKEWEKIEPHLASIRAEVHGEDE